MIGKPRAILPKHWKWALKRSPILLFKSLAVTVISCVVGAPIVYGISVLSNWWGLPFEAVVIMLMGGIFSVFMLIIILDLAIIEAYKKAKNG